MNNPDEFDQRVRKLLTAQKEQLNTVNGMIALTRQLLQANKQHITIASLQVKSNYHHKYLN